MFEIKSDQLIFNIIKHDCYRFFESVSSVGGFTMGSANIALDNLVKNVYPFVRKQDESVNGDFWRALSNEGYDILSIKNRFSEDFIDLSDNDYFSIRNHPDLKNIQLEIEFENLQSEVFRVRNNSPHFNLINRLKELLGSIDVFLSSSGYVANIVALQSIMNGDVIVYGDQRIHESWHTAYFAAKSREVAIGKKIFNQDSKMLLFQHNNARYLEKLLKRFGNGIVILESVYSVEGDILDIEVVNIAKKYDCVIILDESHSVGGTVSHEFSFNKCFNLGVDIITFSLSKALASHGGVVAIQPELLSKLNKINSFGKNESLKLLTDSFRMGSPLMFSNSLVGADLCLARANLITKQESYRCNVTRVNADFIKNKLKNSGISCKSSSLILFIDMGKPNEANEFHKKLLLNGVLGSFYAPITIRLTITPVTIVPCFSCNPTPNFIIFICST